MMRSDVTTRLFGIGAAAVGAVYFYLAVQLPFQGSSGPGVGFFPVIIAVILMLAGVFAGLRPHHAAEVSAFGAGTVKKVILVFASLIAFCLLLPRAGYIPSALVVMVSVLRQFEASWVMTIAVSIAATLGTYTLFVMLLGLQLPQGLWFAA